MKYLLRAFYLMGGGVAVLLAIYAFWSSWVTAQLEQRVSALRAAGMPTKLTDLRKEVPPPEQNAAVWIRRAAPGLEAIDKEIGANMDFSKPVTTEMALKMDEVLTAHRGAIDAVHKAANCDSYNPEPDYGVKAADFISEQLNRIPAMRSAARALYYQSMVQLHYGKIDESLDTSIDMLMLADHLGEEPGLVSFLVRNAIVYMALARIHDLLAADLDTNSHARIEDALAAQNIGDAFRESVKGERVLAFESVEQLGSFSRTIPIPAAVKMQLIELIDYLNRAHDAAHASDIEFRKVLTQDPPWGGFVAATAPGMLAAHQASVRVTASIRALRIVNAIQAQQPADVKDLKIDESVWVDPANGKRMKIIQKDGMWTVYSVGRNLRDDGGVVDPRKDGDVGWSLPMK